MYKFFDVALNGKDFFISQIWNLMRLDLKDNSTIVSDISYCKNIL